MFGPGASKTGSTGSCDMLRTGCKLAALATKSMAPGERNVMKQQKNVREQRPCLQTNMDLQNTPWATKDGTKSTNANDIP